MSIIAKMVVAEIRPFSDHPDAARLVTFRAVSPGDTDEINEDERFHKYTPAGELVLTVDNRPAWEQLVKGQAYYVRIESALIPA